MTKWGKTIGPDGNCRMRHYAFDKLACGLVDMHLYAGHPDALARPDRRDLLPAGPIWRYPGIIECGNP
jgi:hypothetical protein